MYRSFILSLAAFILGAAAVYVLILFGVTVYWSLTGVHDRDGGGAMALGFIIGPAIALPAGLMIGVATWMALRRRAQRTGPASAETMRSDRRKFLIFGAAVIGWFAGYYLTRSAFWFANPMTFDTWWKVSIAAWLPDIGGVIGAFLGGFIAARLSLGASGLPG